MTTVRDALLDADPLRHEPADDRRRERVREAVMAGAPSRSSAGGRRFSRRALLATGVVVVLGIAGLKTRFGGTARLEAAVRFEVRAADTNPTPGLQVMRIRGRDASVYVQQTAVVTNDDVLGARVISGSDGSYDVEVTFTAAGAEKMRRATAAHNGRPLAILVDGELVAAPTVRSAIGDRALVTGNFSRSEAERIAGGIVPR